MVLKSWQAPVKPGLDLSDDFPVIPVQPNEDAKQLKESEMEHQMEHLEMKSPRLSYLLWNSDISKEWKGINQPPNRSVHESARAHFRLFLAAVEKEPKELQKVVRQRRQESDKHVAFEQRMRGSGVQKKAAGSIENQNGWNTILVLYAMGLFLLLSCPLWCEGYRVVQERLGRDTRLSNGEAVMEILYTTSQLAVVVQVQTALAMLQIRLGFPFHFIHFVVVIAEHIFLHHMVQFKFAWLHKLFHEVQPLYRLVHLEHHICKGTYPTTPAAGLWEVWLEGGTLFFCNTLGSVPYLYLHGGVGPNVIVHNMWPHKSCIQWHTLHHVAHSDVYAVNVPSDNDEKFSRDVKNYRERLQCSLFVRHPNMSDVAGFAMSICLGLTLHYLCGLGFFHVWSEGNLHFTG
eukprot:Skav213659  [mRNA]  locus=scaffold2012:448272:462909:- [translate_table: standard]